MYKTVEDSSWEYSLPATTDLNNNATQISVDVNTATFVTFSSNSLSIENLLDSSTKVGSYTIDITLFDTEKATSTDYQIILNIKEPID